MKIFFVKSKRQKRNKSEKIRNHPLKPRRMNHHPLKPRGMNHHPLKPRGMNHHPLKPRRMNYHPLKPRRMNYHTLKPRRMNPTNERKSRILMNQWPLNPKRGGRHIHFLTRFCFQRGNRKIKYLIYLRQVKVYIQVRPLEKRVA